MLRKKSFTDAVLVIGLGRFGAAIAVTLEQLGKDVLAIESDPKLVQKWANQFQVIEADACSSEALAQIGAADFPVAIVSVGTALEASVLITANLVDLGIKQIWAKATSREQGTILKRIGAHHVVYPEFNAGKRVAHMISGNVLDYIEMEDNFTIVKMLPPRHAVGTKICESNWSDRYGITLIGVKSPGKTFESTNENTIISTDDILLVAGENAQVEKFAQGIH